MLYACLRALARVKHVLQDAATLHTHIAILNKVQTWQVRLRPASDCYHYSEAHGNISVIFVQESRSFVPLQAHAHKSSVFTRTQHAEVMALPP